MENKMKMYTLESTYTADGKHHQQQHYEFGLYKSEMDAQTALDELATWTDETQNMYIVEALPETIAECIEWLGDKWRLGLAPPETYLGLTYQELAES